MFFSNRRQPLVAQRHLRWQFFCDRLGVPDASGATPTFWQAKKKKNFLNPIFSTKKSSYHKNVGGGGGHLILCPHLQNRGGGDASPPPPDFRPCTQQFFCVSNSLLLILKVERHICKKNHCGVFVNVQFTRLGWKVHRLTMMQWSNLTKDCLFLNKVSPAVHTLLPLMF